LPKKNFQHGGYFQNGVCTFFVYENMSCNRYFRSIVLIFGLSHYFLTFNYTKINFRFVDHSLPFWIFCQKSNGIVFRGQKSIRNDTSQAPPSIAHERTIDTTLFDGMINSSSLVLKFSRVHLLLPVLALFQYTSDVVSSTPQNTRKSLNILHAETSFTW
jgi:hypothetical protein